MKGLRVAVAALGVMVFSVRATPRTPASVAVPLDRRVELRVTPTSNAQIVKSLSPTDAVFILQTEADGWALVKDIASGVRGWTGAFRLQVKTVNSDMFIYVSTKADRPFVKLRSQPSLASSARSVRPAEIILVSKPQRSDGWHRAQLLTSGEVGWILLPKVKQYLRRIPVPQETNLSRPDTESQKTVPWWERAGVMSGVGAALFGAFVAIYLAGTNHAQLRALLHEVTDRFGDHLNRIAHSTVDRVKTPHNSNQQNIPITLTDKNVVQFPDAKTGTEDRPN